MTFVAILTIAVKRDGMGSRKERWGWGPEAAEVAALHINNY